MIEAQRILELEAKYVLPSPGVNDDIIETTIEQLVSKGMTVIDGTMTEQINVYYDFDRYELLGSGISFLINVNEREVLGRIKYRLDEQPALSKYREIELRADNINEISSPALWLSPDLFSARKRIQENWGTTTDPFSLQLKGDLREKVFTRAERKYCFLLPDNSIATADENRISIVFDHVEFEHLATGQKGIFFEIEVEVHAMSTDYDLALQITDQTLRDCGFIGSPKSKYHRSCEMLGIEALPEASS
ncbi:hypothetical protein [Martelella mangrovi]|uniref:CYTH domain-containing protein n=1 Tax=Martelella mangrovi TaxID=1397477 RepID=A0ABV2ICS7_9HYPH